MNLPALLVLAIHVAGLACASPANPTPKAPTVTLDKGTFTGTTYGNVAQFLGIPFAQAPTGNLRYRLPQVLPAYSGKNDATQYGPSCPGQSLNIAGTGPTAAMFLFSTLIGTTTNSSEDCLSVNVLTPSTATSKSNLPVVVWIYGGGFEFGGSSAYNGSTIVERSIALGEPIIYVSMNYRASGFGFMASAEIRAAGVGNLGLQDQRFALEWVQKYISNFGGDPSKVTIWGESAGASSASMQLLYNGGNPGNLFRGAFLQSGFPMPVGPLEQGQVYYDYTVEQVNCSSASDTLNCLRSVPYAALQAVFNQMPSAFTYQSLSLVFSPHTDGVFFLDNPQQMILNGQVANVPIVAGDCDDEGTIFASPTLNVTTDAQFESYIKTIVFPNITDAQFQQLAEAYPANVTLGSPFDTGVLNALTPQFKRTAAFGGDLLFHGPRRLLLNQFSGRQNMWSFLSKRKKSTPGYGSFHGTDLVNIYFGGELADYLIRFTNNLNPNGQGSYNWPQYETSSRSLLTFWDGFVPITVTSDTFRANEMNLLNNLTLIYPVL